MSRNLADLVSAAAQRTPERLALICGDRRVSWVALNADVDALAAGLRSTRLEPGSRVALLLGNTPEFVIAYFAVLRAGLVAVPVNTRYTIPEVRWLLADSGVGLVLTDVAGAALARSAVEADPLEVIVFGEDAYRDLLRRGRNAARPPRTEIGGEDLAVLPYTSGTSGRPKGTMLSHRALLANLDQCQALEPPPMSAGDVVLIVVPLFHVYALNSGLGMVVRTGATAVLLDRFDPVETLAEIRRHGVSNIAGAPAMYAAWAAQPDAREVLSAVRLMVSGSSPLPTGVFEEFRTVVGRPIYEGYGLTEASPVVTSALSSPKLKPGSVGRPVPGVELRLLDAHGDEAAEGDPGEIVIRGPNLLTGYWPDGSDGPDAQGWFATGDVGYVDSDGELFLVDRRKELVLVNGFNVYPREVEEAICQHPAVAEAAVIAVRDAVTGEAVKAFVVPRPGATLTVDEVIRHCEVRLARFKCPSVVEMVAELPHSANGKVAKGRLRARERT